MAVDRREGDEETVVRALVVSGRPLLAEALAAALSGEGCAVRSTARDALATAERRAAGASLDLVLLDARGHEDLPELCGEVSSRWAGVPLVVLAPADDASWEAIAGSAGAAGVVTAGDGLSHVLHVVQEVARGGLVPRSPTPGPRRSRTRTRVPEPEQLLLEQLTEKERSVLHLLCGGASSGDLAQQLGLSPNTIRTHLQNLMGKLGVHSRLEAVALARRAREGSMEALRELGPLAKRAGATGSVLVAHPHRIFREALARALRDGGTVEEAPTIDSVRAAMSEHIVDLLVLDGDLAPEPELLRLVAALKRDGGPRILALRHRPSRNSVRAAIEAGADGFLTTDATVAELNVAVATVRTGQSYVPGAMLSMLLSDLIARRREEDEIVDRFARLSDREREVVALLVEGGGNEAIAAAMVVSLHTARSHVQNVVRKLGLRSRLEVVAVANEYDLVERFARKGQG